jgi:hypothetical protein
MVRLDRYSVNTYREFGINPSVTSDSDLERNKPDYV